MVDLGDLKEMLNMLRDYPEVWSVKYRGMEISLTRPEPEQISTEVQPAKIPIDTDMPPDNVMLFASTPTFDDMTRPDGESTEG